MQDGKQAAAAALTEQLIVNRLESIHEDVTDLKSSFRDSQKEITAAIKELVAIQSNQAAIGQAYERLVKQFDKLETKYEEFDKRIDILEKDVEPAKKMVDWAWKGLFGLAGIVGVFALKFIGIG